MSKKHKHDDHEEHVDESWLIPYADLLTLLLALFIVLYAMSATDAKKFQEMSQAFSIAFNSGVGVLDQSAVVSTPEQVTSKDRTKRADDNEDNQSQQSASDLTKQEQQKLREKEQQQLEKLKQQLDQYIKQNGLTTQLETKLNQSQLMITISDNALFDSGSAAIKSDAKALAVSIGTMLKDYPGYEITVAGHTDNKPINTYEFASNYELSAKRAINFMSILISTGKLDPKLISPTGYGEHRPIDSNKTEQGRAKNRRVEVSIIRKYVDLENSKSVSAGS
ncbi:flagellar motor protein MotB [Paenibacillus sambharensis]|uniref:Flagellar motor protein MotB n=1 Tax=Paenibacillus sambharensis TaxID=1803190 RepID=A0A2W1LCK6_9BACL|nr:flagellar motor protein MotB [Paenibacillus sambharensis]PZD96419.1 flagellar motor protein MotB [Paenibacillus sambharensis]